MANPTIKIKRSAVPGKIPSTITLPIGEFAINTYDGKVFIQQDQGGVGVGSTVVVVNPWSVGTGTDTYNTYFTNGNVGVGTTVPTSKLHVFGDASITGVATIATLKISSGILSATSGIITYYGDGSNLTNIASIARVTVSSTAPLSPSEGDLWYYTTLARLFVYFNDGSSLQWVDASPFNLESGGGASVSVGATAPTGATSGDLWYNSNYGRLFLYYKDGSSDQWVDAAPFNYPTRDTPTKTENNFIATAGQTTFSVTYEVGYIEVYLNGIRLSSSEYIATSGSSVILSEPTSLGDVIDIVEIATGEGPTGPQGPIGPSGQTNLSGVGTTSSTEVHYPLFVTGTGTTVPFISTTSNYFNFIPSSGRLSINQLNVGFITSSNVYTTGIITATDFNSTSDINLKNNIQSIDDPLKKVMQINGVSFNWKSNNDISAGVIAQDVEKVLPEVVKEMDGHKTVNYNGLIGLLIEAVKEQNNSIKLLEIKINNLKEELENKNKDVNNG